MSKSMVLKPRMSEKAYGLSQTADTYIFDVPSSANKLTVAQAVGVQFDVAVKAVNVVNVKGKPKRTVHKRSRPTNGKRSDIKKAYVTLKSGDSIPVFAAQETADAEAAKKDKGQKT